MNNFKTYSAPGFDGITPIFSTLGQVVLTIFLTLFRKTLRKLFQKTFPENFKLAVITPIPKNTILNQKQ